MKSLFPWLTRSLALTALSLSIYLLWIGWTTTTAVGCDFAAFDCDAALASPWAKWLGLPVAAGGVLCYGAALVGSLLAGRADASGRLGWRLLELATPLALGAGIWFTYLQVTALDSFCLYCVATHLSGLLMTIAIIAWRYAAADADLPMPVFGDLTTGKSLPESASAPKLGLATAFGVAGVIVLAGGQILRPPAHMIVNDRADLETTVQLDSPLEAVTTTAKPVLEAETTSPEIKTSPEINKYPRKSGGSRQLSLLRGQLQIDAYDHALIGSPEAPHLVVELMDYACPHCREFHDTLTAAIRRFEGEIGVIVIPVPGEILCNPYVNKARKQSAGACYAAKLSIAVSQMAPEEFEAFHEWMLKDDDIPNRTAALIEARQHVDAEELSKRLQDPRDRLAARIKQYVDLSATIARQGRFGLPAQILGDRFVAGTPDTVDELCQVWSDAFDIEVPSDPVPF